MIEYGKYSKNLSQQLLIIVLEVILIFISYMIHFGGWASTVLNWLNITDNGGNHLRHILLLTANITIFLFYLPTITIFVRRKISLEEAISVPLAFSLYYIGFALLGYNITNNVNWIDWIGIILVILGVSIHLIAEWQRYKFKKNPQNKGKLLTTGLWSLSRHINYFGDLLWVSGMALITRNWWSILIVLFLFSFFYFYNIPLQEKHLAEKYQNQFDQYCKKTKSFIPWIL